MLKQLPDYTKARVLVMGDVMLDRYWHGEAARISPEAPVPVVRIAHETYCPGGAANVALNIAALGAHVVLLGCVGEDEAGARLESELVARNISASLLKMPGICTTTKLRVLSQHQQLVRLDFESVAQALFPISDLKANFIALLDDVDVVVLSDYAKGFLNDVPALIKIARAAGKIVLVDPKGNDFERYRGASLLTPNLKEFEVIVGHCSGDADIAERGFNLMNNLSLENLLITHSDQGMTLLLKNNHQVLHFHAARREVFDVTGAGDTVIGILAAGIATGAPLDQATAIANVAAGISVGKLGAATVHIAELRQALLAEHYAKQRGILSESELLEAVSDARAQGERIVMTNGCFDILHPGHVAYLEQAAALGDRLIVAVNSDACVSRLKGSARPLNNIGARLSVLAGLSAIDWLVSFEDNTPERLASLIRPDVFVKGGDYQLQDLPEARVVESYGGSVQLLPFVDGYSTTNLVQRIQER